MKMNRQLAAIFILFPLLSNAAELEISSTVGMKRSLESLKSNLQKGGDTLKIEYSLSGEQKERLLKGRTCDVLISTKSAVADLVKAGKLNPDGVIDISKSGVGLAVKKGNKKPVMITDSDVKKILLEANSVTYYKQGAAASVMNSVYQKLGITEQMQPKIKFPEHGDPMESAAHGESQYVFAQLSEILGETGIEHVAQLPPNLQTSTVYTAAKCASAKNLKAGEEFIRRLSQPEAMKVYQSKGLESL